MQNNIYKQIIQNKFNGGQSNLVNSAINKAHENLSKYRQGKQDLIARMATDWPEWSCALDFYTSFIHPLLRNSLVLNFINFSEQIKLDNFKIEFYYSVKEDSKVTLKKFNEKFNNNGQEDEVQLIDYAFISIPEIENYLIKEKKLIRENKEVRFVSVRDADIGAHAFFSLFEGIIRNSAKHREKDRNFQKLEVKIIIWENIEDFFNCCEINNETPVNSNLYSCVSISVSEDFYKNNSGKERKISIYEKGKKKDINLVEFLNQKINEEIIDRTTGRLNPGNWGLKEIKACAAFLSGEKLSEVNKKKSSNYLMINKTNNSSRIWTDNKERIIYSIKLEKPHFILVILPLTALPTSNEVISKWQSFGIGLAYIGQLNSGEINTNYDFFVNLDPNASGNIEEIIQKGEIKLPQRRIKSLNNDINFNNEPDEQSAFSFIDKTYTSWLKQIEAFDGKTKLLIYFADEAKPDSWNKKYNCANFLFPKNADDLRNNVRIKLNDNQKLYIISRHMNLCNMKKILTSKTNNALRTKDFDYFEEVSYSNLFFSFLWSLNPEESRSKIVLNQIIESCHLKILVIDERIAQTLEGKNEELEALKNMNIDIAGSLKISSSNPIRFISGKNSSMVQADFTNNFLQIYNIILIHVTRLNDVFNEVSNKYESKEQFINDLMKKWNNKFISFIVHSGRGKTEGDIPTNAPFLEYSIVQKYMIQEPSKFYLTQIALSVL